MKKRKLGILVLVISVVIADQVIKTTIGIALAYSTTQFLVLWNTFVVLGVGCAAYFLGWRRERLIIFTSFALITAGSLSNWIDRLLKGRVIVYLPKIGGPGSRINLADIAINIGVIMAIGLFVIWLSKTIMGPSDQKKREEAK